MRYLLDSDVIMWVLRRHQPTYALLQTLARTEPPRCSALSVFEVWAGVRTNEESLTRDFLVGMRAIQVDKRIATVAGEYWRHFRRRGITLGQVDSLIAATARAHDLTLVTYNRADYPMSDIALYDDMPAI